MRMLTHIAEDILIQETTVASFAAGMFGRIGNVFSTFSVGQEVLVTESAIRLGGVLDFEIGHCYCGVASKVMVDDKDVFSLLPPFMRTRAGSRISRISYS